MTTQQQSHVAVRDTDPIAWRVLQVLLGVSGGILLVSLASDFLVRWSIWKQGDWLINSLNGPVRRGPTGSVLIRMADFLDVTPVTMVIAVQVLLLGVLYGAYYLSVRGLQDPRVALLVSCSPAMFITFWPANVYHGSLRKELIGITALALMLVYLRTRRTWVLVLAGALMVVGVWAHEIVILFGPAFAYLAWRAGRTGRGRLVAVVTGVAAASAVLAGVYVLMNSSAADVGQICEPLTSRGLDDRICSGPLRWLGISSEETLDIVRRRNATPEGLARFAVVVALSAAPLAYLTLLLQNRRVALIGLVAAAPMLPLFVLVIDWGRWLSCGVFAFVAVVMAHALTDDLPLRRRPSLPIVLALVAVCCVVAPYHVNDLVRGGMFAHVYGLAQGLANR